MRHELPFLVEITNNYKTNKYFVTLIRTSNYVNTLEQILYYTNICICILLFITRYCVPKSYTAPACIIIIKNRTCKTFNFKTENIRRLSSSLV